MVRKKSSNNKQFNLKDYKGYVAILIGLFIILFVLIGMAIGMIKDEYFTDSTNSESVVETKDTEALIAVETKESILNETEIQTDIIDSEKETILDETELESETESKLKESKVNKDDPLLILINRNHPVPEDLTYTLIKIEEHHYIDQRAFDDLQDMLAAAKKEGMELVICSSWRSRALQEKLYADKLDEYLSYGYSRQQSEELAAFWVALPGTSEHEIGLALDIVAESYQHLDHSQADTAEQKWLMEHCHEYGFILRYPEDKQDITMIGYEPWHYRYVGKEAAIEIVEQGLCLEEYLLE